jgi:hypothetical protein
VPRVRALSIWDSWCTELSPTLWALGPLLLRTLLRFPIPRRLILPTLVVARCNQLPVY